MAQSALPGLRRRLVYSRSQAEEVPCVLQTKRESERSLVALKVIDCRPLLTQLIEPLERSLKWLI